MGGGLSLSSKPDIFLLIGPPISKKEEVGRYIHSKFNYSYISIQSLYQNEITHGTDNGKLIKEMIDTQKVVPGEISAKLILNHINDMAKQFVFKFVIDGFPDNFEAYEGWKNEISQLVNLQGVINLTTTTKYIDTYISTLNDSQKVIIKKRLDYYTTKTVAIVDSIESTHPVTKIDISSDTYVTLLDKSLTEQFKLIPGPVPSIIFTIGSSGSGMKTQIQNIKEKFGFVSICPKDVLKNANIETNYDSIPIDQLFSALETHFIKLAMEGKNRYILTNFPRKPDEHSLFLQYFHSKLSVIHTFLFTAKIETMKKRIEKAKKDVARVKEIAVESFKIIERIHIFDTEAKTIDDSKKEIEDILKGCPTYPQIPLPKPQILFILGGPGSGKGTQCEYISKKYHLNHISTGDLLREAQKADTPEGQILRPLLAEGKLVPTTMVIGLVLKKITELKSKCNVFLLDGYPRNFENVTFWNRDAACQVELLGVVNLECDDEVVAQRIIERGKISGRSDDNPESVKHRLQTFHDQSQPVINYYSNHPGFVNINTNRTLPEIQKDVDEVFAKKYPSLKP